MTRLLLSIVTVLVLAQVLLVQPGVTFAQSDPGRDAEARGLFEAGRAAFDQGRYPDALGYFDRAYQLSRRPQLLYNLGQVHDRLRHDEDALQAFQQYLKQVPGAENRTEVEHRIQALRQAMIGTFHFTLTPSNAQVWIDGEAKALDNTGRLQVSTGSHEVLIRAQGYEELRQRMNVRGGDMIEMPVTLQRAEATPAVAAVAPVAPVTAVAPTTPVAPTVPVTAVTTTTLTPAPVAEPAAQPTNLAPPPAQPSVVAAPAPLTGVQTLPTLPTDYGPSTATTLGWVAVVPAGLLLVGGATFALLGKSKFTSLENDCSSSCTREEIEDQGGTVKTMELLTNVGLIGGGVLAGLATALFIIGGASGDDQPPAADAPATPAPATTVVLGPTSILARGTF